MRPCLSSSTFLKDTMEVRPYTPADYSTLSKWWTDHSWPLVPEDHLPSTGFIASKDSTPIAAGFIYVTNSCFALMDWLVSDKHSSVEDRDSALDAVLQATFDFSKSNNIKSIYTTTSHKRLISRYESHGFVFAEQLSALTKRI